MGKIEDLLPVRGRALGERALAVFDSLLRAKGYRVERRLLGSIGISLSPIAQFRIRDERPEVNM